MPATCDVCNAELGLLRFRYADGFICKDCYDLASGSNTQTIRKLSLDEVEEAIERRRKQLDVDVEFIPTKRAGDLLQIDERRGLVCLPHNRRTAGDVAAPEFFAVDAIRSCRIESVPRRTEKELATLAARGGDGITLSSLALVIQTRSRKEPYTAQLITTAVKTDGFAFRRSFELAVRAKQLVEKTQQDHA